MQLWIASAQDLAMTYETAGASRPPFRFKIHSVTKEHLAHALMPRDLLKISKVREAAKFCQEAYVAIR